MNHVTCFALCLSSFVALAGVACSGAPDPAPTSSGQNASTKADTTKTPSGSKTPAATGDAGMNGSATPAPVSGTSADTSACGKKADAKTCDDCCLAGTPTALDAADKAVRDCMCAAAACQTACAASECAADSMNVRDEPTDACNKCLDAHDNECGGKFEAVCNADAACKAANSCVTTQCDPLATNTGDGSGGTSGGAFAARTASFSARAMARSAGRQ